jgi:hypothetical protein
MSSSNPPNPNTPPVFNNDAFGQGANPNIDTAYLNANYLRFPTAQGSETLQNIQNSPPDPNNMMPGKGLNYMGQPETPNCKFMRLIMKVKLQKIWSYYPNLQRKTT